jgi:hypothetical protein
MSEQQRGPTIYQTKLMAALNRRGIYPDLEKTIPNPKVHDGYIENWPIRLDLYIKEKALAIEIDGSSHKRHAEKDAERDAYLLSVGIKTVRLSNSHVLRFADELAALVKGMI